MEILINLAFPRRSLPGKGPCDKRGGFFGFYGFGAEAHALSDNISLISTFPERHECTVSLLVRVLFHVAGANVNFSHWDMFKSGYAVAQKLGLKLGTRKPTETDPGGRDSHNSNGL